MRIVLLSGGSGKRLWPISNDTRSKQFLKVIKNEQGELESMVQRVWRQLTEQDLAAHSVISTGRAQTDLLTSQLGDDVPFIIEPERRDTFAAIALAATYLHSEKQANVEEVVIVQPVDAFVEAPFFATLRKLEALIQNGDFNLGLIGVKPTFPSEKYGYIMPTADQLHVKKFIEKPKQAVAAELIKHDHALWNCGVFAFRLGFLIDELTQRNLPTTFHGLLEQFGQLPKRSFDYEVVEKIDKIGLVEYEGGWKDLGTWSTLTDEMGTSVIGRGSLHEEATNTHLINELDIDVKVLGIKDAVIAIGSDGILVSGKEESARIKDYLVDNNQRPMFEERRWGWYRVLDFVKNDDGTDILTKRIAVGDGKNLSYQSHNHRAEVWTIISGEGEFVLDGKLIPVKKGDVLNIQVGQKHGIKGIRDLEFIEVQMGSPLIEEDIIRYEMDWEKMKQGL